MGQIIAFSMGMGFDFALEWHKVHIIWKSKGCGNNWETQDFCEDFSVHSESLKSILVHGTWKEPGKMGKNVKCRIYIPKLEIKSNI